MPLKKSASKAAFKKNVEIEMESGKPQKQSLAIAFDVQRRNKRKKMADGGKISPNPTPSPAQAVSKGATMSQSEYNDWYESHHKAKGGEIKNPSLDAASSEVKPPKKYSEPLRNPASKEEIADQADKFANGGEVCAHCEGTGKYAIPADLKENYGEDEYDDQDEHRESSISESIRNKLKFEKYANGGEVESVDDPFDNGEGISHFQEEGPGTRQKYNSNAREYNAGDDRQISKQPTDSNEHGDSREEDSENKHDRVSAIRKKYKAGK